MEDQPGDYPICRRMTEASCAKCHKNKCSSHAEKLNVAYHPAAALRLSQYARFENRASRANARKIGSSCRRLGDDWIATAGGEADHVMPRVWYNSNSNTPEDAARNEAEINATVAYLFANSEEFRPETASPPRGDAKRGEQIVKSVGCLGCHVVDEKTRAEVGPHRTFGQPLQNIGNKTSYEWLFDWVRDPKHYSPPTKCPIAPDRSPGVRRATYRVDLKQTAADAPKRRGPGGP